MPEAPKHKGKPTQPSTTPKGKLTMKELALVEALPKTKNVAEAGRIAGYCDRHEAHRALKRVERKMPDILDAHGLTEDYVIEECLKPGLKAIETKHAAHKGIFLDHKDVIAWGPRHQFQETYWRLRGRLNGNSDESTGDQPAGITIRLELSSPDEQAEVAAIIAARRVGSGQPAVDAESHPDAGRQGSA